MNTLFPARTLIKCTFALLALTLVVSVKAGEKLQVYILAGQSNMEGHAHLRVLDYLGEHEETAGLLKKMKAADGSYLVVPHTHIAYLTGGGGWSDKPDVEVVGPLTAGYGSLGGKADGTPGEKIGPEWAFGITMQESLGKPVLIIKTAWGGQSLHTDYRSPSSGPYPQTEHNAKKFETEEKRKQLEAQTGKRYRDMVAFVKKVLADPGQVHPEYDKEAGFDLAGFAWFQGFNDLVGRDSYPNRDQSGGYDAYTDGLANLIRDLRKDLNAPELPVAIGVMGVNGPIENVEERYKAVHGNFRAAMAAPAEMPEFKGNVVAVPTAPYWNADLDAIDRKRNEIRSKAQALKTKNKNHENADGSMDAAAQKAFMEKFTAQLLSDEDLDLETRAKSNAGYHYLGCAKTYSQVGVALAEGLLGLQGGK